MNIDDILDELIEALIVECAGELPDGLERQVAGVGEQHRGHVVRDALVADTATEMDVGGCGAARL